MTNNKRTIAILSITSILIFSGFGYSPFAFSTGSYSGQDKNDDRNEWDDFKNFKKWKDGKKNSEPEIESGLCNSPDNIIKNGCFEDPDVNTGADWDIYPKSNDLPFWEATWVNPNACVGYPEDVQVGQLELQEGILGGPAEGTQHAELDSDCNGPNGPSGGEELTSVIISQGTKEVTSADNEYLITFAYKARPGKNLPLSTNGLTVEWNGADVTPELKFDKNKWKYASVTVNGLDMENGGPGPSVLKFTDTGTPDTFGTFLDDVSVIKIPKPVVTIILTKEIDNSADPNNNLVLNNPDDFDITLYVGSSDDTGSAIPGTQLGEDNPNVLLNGGAFRISENAPNYVATIDGSGCPEVSTDPSTFSAETDFSELEPGDILTCNILNTFVPPPQIILKKALTNDNGGTASANDFTVNIWDENGPNGPDGDPETDDANIVESVYFDKVTSSVVIPLSAGKYVMTESIIPAGPDGDPTMTEDNPAASTLGDYTTVLIAGDTLCPSMENEEFTLEEGQHITCTIYNDDNFVEGQPDDEPVEPGIIFDYGHVEFHVISQAGFCDGTGPFPCIDEAGSGLIVVPNINPNTGRSLTPTTLILLTVQNTVHSDRNAGCQVTGIAMHDNSEKMGFVMLCPDLFLNDEDTWSANYALIETCTGSIDPDTLMCSIPEPEP